MCREIKARVEVLNTALIAQVSVDAETAAWVGNLDSSLYEKLVKTGLVPARAEQDAIEPTKLGPFLAGYMESRSTLKPGTLTAYGHTRRNLLTFFGADKPLADFTNGDADEFDGYLNRPKAKKGAGLSVNTVNRRYGIAKQFFAAAIRKKLIADNPFDRKGLAVRGNKAKQFYVTREMADRVLEACPDAEWRLLFALSRFGGLRCPSEHLGLRWGDIDWARGRMTIHSPKTEHHRGGESRVMPIFPEVREYLEEVFDQAAVGTEHVITRYRHTNSNLRTQLHRIVRRAGLEPWPKTFHNLRATRQTELANHFPTHVVCKWIGNTAAVAAEHYLQITDEHFEQAKNVGQKVGHSTQESAGKARQPILTNPGIAEGFTGMPSAADLHDGRTKIRTTPQKHGETGGKSKQCCRKCCTRPKIGPNRRRLALAARAHSPGDARADRLGAFPSPGPSDQGAKAQASKNDAAGLGDHGQTEAEIICAKRRIIVGDLRRLGPTGIA